MSNSSDDSEEYEAPPGDLQSEMNPNSQGAPHNHQGHEHSEQGEMISLAPALDEARKGLKSKVQVLIDALPTAHLYIPLAEDLSDAPDGVRVEWKGELTFRPHMILNEDHSIYAVAYTEPELVEAMQSALGWETSGEELKFVCVPAHVAFDLAQMNIEGESVAGLVFNPGTDRELVLQRDEVSSLAQGTAIPLVGYVSALESGQDTGTELVEGAANPPSELLDALDEAKNQHDDLIAVEVHTTFNPERDRQPHLSIFLTVVGRHDLDREALADKVMDGVAPHLPSPGYADIVFRDAPN